MRAFGGQRLGRLRESPGQEGVKKTMLRVVSPNGGLVALLLPLPVAALISSDMDSVSSGVGSVVSGGGGT